MIRGLLWLVVVLVLGYCGTTIPIGAPRALSGAGWPYSTSESRLTFVGHVRAIWHTEEVQDLKNGLEEQAGPAAREVKRKLHEVTADDHDPGRPPAAIDAGVADAGAR